MNKPTELLPCPMCGHRSPFTYITFSTAVLRCSCGVTMEHAAVRVMYERHSVPEALKPYTYEATLLQIQDRGRLLSHPEHGFIGVNAMAAFEYEGVTARWNRREVAA